MESLKGLPNQPDIPQATVPSYIVRNRSSDIQLPQENQTFMASDQTPSKNFTCFIKCTLFLGLKDAIDYFVEQVKFEDKELQYLKNKRDGRTCEYFVKNHLK